MQTPTSDGPPALRVLRGRPSETELAALAVVLAALRAQAAAEAAAETVRPARAPAPGRGSVSWGGVPGTRAGALSRRWTPR